MAKPRGHLPTPFFSAMPFYGAPALMPPRYLLFSLLPMIRHATQGFSVRRSFSFSPTRRSPRPYRRSSDISSRPRYKRAPSPPFSRCLLPFLPSPLFPTAAFFLPRLHAVREPAACLYRVLTITMQKVRVKEEAQRPQRNSAKHARFVPQKKRRAEERYLRRNMAQRTSRHVCRCRCVILFSP